MFQTLAMYATQW